jgi:hypothetical protein
MRGFKNIDEINDAKIWIRHSWSATGIPISEMMVLEKGLWLPME